MTSDFFGGLGGLMKGLSSFVPQDDPNVKLLNAQAEVNDLKSKLTDVYAEIGKIAFEKYRSVEFAEYADKVRLLQSSLTTAEKALESAQQKKEEAEQAEREKAERETCPNCGAHNPEGTKFCLECGSKLGVLRKNICSSCGAKLADDVRFCGECGAKQQVV